MSGDKQSSGGGLSAKTLLIAGAASAVTAVIVPMLWRPGTLFAAAATPIIVALVTEALRRPVDTVSAVTGRRTTRFRVQAPVQGTREPRDAEETFDPLAPPTAEELARIPDATTAPRRLEVKRRRITGRQWRLAIITGLVAFLGAAAVVTASELALFGDSVGTGERRTSYFGGRGSDATPTPTPTPTPAGDATPTPTPTETPTPTPTPSPTPTPEETPTPEPTVSPVPTPTPVPEAATPVPTPTPAP